VMLAGVIALLLSLLVWGPLNRRRNHFGGYGSGTPSLARQRSVHGTSRHRAGRLRRDRQSAL